MSRRLVPNGTTETRGAHVSEATVLWLQSMAVLTAGDSVELQRIPCTHGDYFAADDASFWGVTVE